jgi:glycosyltransferase involved in cell wall biosynthesis
MKKVLMITYAFPPMSVVGVYRTLKFCKFLPEFGWEPVVLTVSKGKDWAYDESLLADIPPGMRIHRTRTFEPLIRYESFRQRRRKGAGNSRDRRRQDPLQKESKSILQRMRLHVAGWLSTPDKQAFWFPFALSAGRNILRQEGIDLIYTSSPPHSTHLIGYFLKRFSGLPWVADFRDPWTLNEYFQEKPTTTRMKQLEAYLERLVINGCDHLVANTRSVAEAFRGRFDHLAPLRVSVIPNGYDPEDFQGLEPHNFEKFTITHLGSFYGRRQPIEFLKGLRLFLKRHPEAKQRLKVLFVGNIEEKILNRIREHDLLEVVECRPHEPQRQALRLALSSHLLLLILGHDPKAAAIIPAKLFEYLFSGKPILALVSEGETAELIRSHDAGTVITSPDVEEIGRSLQQYYEGYLKGDRFYSRSNSREMERYHRRHLTAELAEIFDRLVSRQSAGVIQRRRSLERAYGST